MARKHSFTNVEGFQSIDPHSLAKQMTAVGVAPKLADWNDELKSYQQKVNVDGVPQWVIQTLLYPLDGDTVHEPEVVPVTVASKAKPSVQPGMPVEFSGFGAWNYVLRDRETRRIIGVGRSFMAEGFRQVGDGR